MSKRYHFSYTFPKVKAAFAQQTVIVESTSFCKAQIKASKELEKRKGIKGAKNLDGGRMSFFTSPVVEEKEV